MTVKVKGSKGSKEAPKGRDKPQEAQQGPSPQEVTEGQQEGKGGHQEGNGEGGVEVRASDPIRGLSPQKAKQWVSKACLVFSVMSQEGPEGSASYDGYEMNGGECALMFIPTVTRKGKEVDGEMECRGVYSNWGYAASKAFKLAWKAEGKWIKDWKKEQAEKGKKAQEQGLETAMK